MSRTTGFALLVLVATAAGCGVPVGGSPERIAPSSVPYGLLAPSSTAPPLADTGRAVPIFLVDGDRLVAVTRHVTGTNVPARTLSTLLLGPTPPEIAHGYRSAIPSHTRLISLDVVGKVATVDLTAAFGALGGSDQVLAVAQIVFTLTASPRIHSVQFAIGDTTVEVPDGHGSLDTAPRTREDYRAQAPEIRG
jgi:spore germination protein GerM